MSNQTTQNNEDNREENKKTNLISDIRSIWSGWQYGNITFEDEDEVNVEEIQELLDDSDEGLLKD